MIKLDSQKKDKHKAILEAAALLFAQKGYAKTVMSEIAVQAGIGKGTIYEYFNSKEDLFFAVFEWFSKEISHSMKVSITALSGTVADRIRALGDSLISSWIDMIDFFSLVMEFWSASSNSVMQERFKTAFRKAYGDFRFIISGLFREGVKADEFKDSFDPDSLAAALVGSWDALLLQKWFDPDFDVVNVSRHFLDIVLSGIAKPKP